MTGRPSRFLREIEGSEDAECSPSPSEDIRRESFLAAADPRPPPPRVPARRPQRTPFGLGVFRRSAAGNRASRDYEIRFRHSVDPQQGLETLAYLGDSQD